MHRHTKPILTLLICFLLLCSLFGSIAWSECSLDHFIIGCNPDGIWGTSDDNDLCVNVWQKYRNSQESDQFYGLTRAANFITNHPYRLGEPGFDAYQATTPSAVTTYDPNHTLLGSPEIDYSLSIKCISISDGLRVLHKDSPQFTIDEVGQIFSHSLIQHLRNDSHMHLSYQADSGTDLRWITWQVVDELDDGHIYQPSEPITVIFNTDPNEGDIVIDGEVNMLDLVSLASHWQDPNATIDNDFYERADTNQDGFVDWFDFQCLENNWTGALSPRECLALMVSYLNPNAMLEQLYTDIQSFLTTDPNQPMP